MIPQRTLYVLHYVLLAYIPLCISATSVQAILQYKAPHCLLESWADLPCHMFQISNSSALKYS